MFNIISYHGKANKITMRYKFTLNRMALIKNTESLFSTSIPLLLP